ncbi:hypothetical protein N2152v2_009880 [Parachlorella kessleri]
MKANVEGYGDKATTLVSKEAFRFIVDEPPKLGGRGLGPNPLTYFLGSLAGCTQYTIHMIANEMKLPQINRISWAAEGEYDLRGVRGEEGVTARFQKVRLSGTVDGDASQEDLDTIAHQVDKRCIVAATVQASGKELALLCCRPAGADIQLSLKKGSVSHDCEPACELHRLASEGTEGASGVTKGQVSRESDSPQFAGTAGQGQARARGYHTAAWAGVGRRSFHGSPAWLWANGEDVARENMQADKTPQLQKETSEQDDPETRGGSYAGAREAPSGQAPLSGSEGQVAKEASELSGDVHPQDIGTAEGGKPVEAGDAPAEGFSERMAETKDQPSQSSQLGVQPQGDE